MLKEQIREVILSDYARLMETPGSTIGKFILIAVGIEFLGACLDRQHMNATGRSEKRFNTAIRELFPKKYHHFTQLTSIPNLFLDFRCPVIHQFRAGKSLYLCSRMDRQGVEERHLTYRPDGTLVLIAEEFYVDLAAAGARLVNRQEE